MRFNLIFSRFTEAFIIPDVNKAHTKFLIKYLCLGMVLFSALSFGLPPTAMAYTFGNANRQLEQGSIYAGVNFSEMDRDFDLNIDISTQLGPGSGTDSEKLDISQSSLMLGMRLTDEANIEAFFGEIKITDSYDDELEGNIFGGIVTYKGIFLSVATGTFSDTYVEGDISQQEIGFVFSKEMENQMSAFGAIIYSKQTVELTATQRSLDEFSSFYGFVFNSITLTYEEDTAIGVLAGLEIELQQGILGAVEIHMLHETGIGLRLIAAF